MYNVINLKSFTRHHITPNLKKILTAFKDKVHPSVLVNTSKIERSNRSIGY